jgi:hypothetical protein
MRAAAIALLGPALAWGAIFPAYAPAATSAGGRSSGGCHVGIVRAGRLAPGRTGAGPPCPAAAARVVSRAPSAPPLLGGSGAAPGAGLDGGAVAGGDASASAPPSSGDPLVENGLGSPLCGAPAELPAAGRRNCETSGFEAAGAPTGNYGLDVHIETGLLGLSTQTVLQDYLVEPVWMGLVWVVHALVVALEWCFALDLLDSSALGGLERSLRATRSSFTGPWLVLAFAVAAVAAAYNGLVRRRVAETLGQSALMLAMMAGGLWVIADPAGTVGALGRWVDAASAGTLGTVVQGSPAHASRTLAQSMGGLFGAVVGAPWCYLEFGNVGWCEDPARLEPRLRAAGLALLTRPHFAKCEGGERDPKICEGLESEAPRASVPSHSRSAALMRAARTNGEVFLALPANEAARNSIDEPGSLLRVLCGGSESATECRGPTAAEAEFRTQGATTSRIAGLLLIVVGAVGMVRLLGFIALHLLGAEIVSLFYLLLAPAAVLAPALGDGGRAAFRTWATRLVGAVCSKLIFSFLLGAVLLMTRTLIGLEALGWWTRWLLVAVLWWGAHRQRHQVLGFIAGEHRGSSERHRSLLQRFKQQLEGPRTVVQGASWIRKKLSGPAPSVERRRTLERIGGQRAQATADEQVTRMLEREHAAASAHAAPGSEAQSELSAERTRLQRVRGEQAKAAAAGDTRRAARLGDRVQRIQGEVDRGQFALNEARRTAAEGERAQLRTGRAYTAEQLRERSEWLDAQAALPAARAGSGAGGSAQSGDAGAGAAGRDYGGLAGMLGYGREQYEQLQPRVQREARMEIDRELALRRELRDAAGSVLGFEPARPRSPGRRERRRADRDFDRALDQRLRESGHAAPRSRERPSHRERPRDVPPHHSPRPDPPRRSGGGFESPVLRDAHEVARRRKRQLGG